MSWYIMVSPPVAEPVTLDDAKAWLRIGTTGEDDLVSSLIAAARNAFETETGIALVTRRLTRYWQQWPDALVQGCLSLTPGPSQALISVTIHDSVGASLDTITDRFRFRGGQLERLASAPLVRIPEGGTLAVTYDAGFGAPGDVPDRFRQALRDMIRHAYSRKEDAASMAGLATPFRAVSL